MKTRLDQALVSGGLVTSRSQAESYIKLGSVRVNGRLVTKAGYLVGPADKLQLTAKEQYVSRAGLKLASVAKLLGLDFRDKVVLDVGSSTGGFTDYALRHGARHIIAVDVGTDQLHPSLRGNPAIELHERTDIRDLRPIGREQPENNNEAAQINIETPDIVLIDVSFISLREILPSVADLSGRHTQIVAMVKPQFEAGQHAKHKGVIKNDAMRRDILKDFEIWAKKLFIVKDKADSDVTGSKGNRERFYLLQKLATPRGKRAAGALGFAQTPRDEKNL